MRGGKRPGAGRPKKIWPEVSPATIDWAAMAEEFAAGWAETMRRMAEGFPDVAVDAAITPAVNEARSEATKEQPRSEDGTRLAPGAPSNGGQTCAPESP